MSTRRTVTLTLTEQQFHALASAMADADSLDEEGEMSDPRRLAEAAVRDRAWRKLVRAWYSRARTP